MPFKVLLFCSLQLGMSFEGKTASPASPASLAACQYLLNTYVLFPFLFSIRRTEHSALKVLREQLFAHKSDLISAFQDYDKKNTGAVLLTNHRLNRHAVFIHVFVQDKI